MVFAWCQQDVGLGVDWRECSRACVPAAACCRAGLALQQQRRRRRKRCAHPSLSFKTGVVRWPSYRFLSCDFDIRAAACFSLVDYPSSVRLFASLVWFCEAIIFRAAHSRVCVVSVKSRCILRRWFAIVCLFLFFRAIGPGLVVDGGGPDWEVMTWQGSCRGRLLTLGITLTFPKQVMQCFDHVRSLVLFLCVQASFLYTQKSALFRSGIRIALHISGIRLVLFAHRAAATGTFLPFFRNIGEKESSTIEPPL